MAGPRTRAQPRGRHPAIDGSAAQPRGAPTDDRESDGGDSGRRRGIISRLRRHSVARDAERAQRSTQCAGRTTGLARGGVQHARGARELYLLRPGSGLAVGADGFRERTEGGWRRRVGHAAHVRARRSGNRPDRAGDGGGDRRRNVSGGLPEHAGAAARVSHGPSDQPGYGAGRAALLARTDAGLLPPAGGSRAHHGRRGGGGADRSAAAVSRPDHSHGRARRVPVPEGPRKNDRVRRRRGRRLLQHHACRNQTRARFHGRRPGRIAPGGDCERAVCEDVLGGPGCDREADPAGRHGGPCRRGRGSGEDRALSNGERNAGPLRVCALRAEPARADGR